MRHSYKQVRELALGLSYDQREKLSQELWESLHPPGEDLSREEIDAAWAAEIERRIADMDSGEAKTIPA
jgi:putative addiction module component (TIGR02574 family)